MIIQSSRESQAMIYGVGVDIVEIDRVERAAKSPRFIERVFTEAEIAYCAQKANPYPSFAARFAAKEAVYKCLSPLVKASAYQEVEVVMNAHGAPEIRLSGDTSRKAYDAGVERVFISLSHSDSMAQAFAIAMTGSAASYRQL